MAIEKKVPNINVGDRVKVSRPGQKAMTGKVVRNDEMVCDIERDDVPPVQECKNPGGSMRTVQRISRPLMIHIFGSDSGTIKVEKIA